MPILRGFINYHFLIVNLRLRTACRRGRGTALHGNSEFRWPTNHSPASPLLIRTTATGNYTWTEYSRFVVAFVQFPTFPKTFTRSTPRQCYDRGSGAGVVDACPAM